MHNYYLSSNAILCDFCVLFQHLQALEERQSEVSITYIRVCVCVCVRVKLLYNHSVCLWAHPSVTGIIM
jgi:hypothetical protein